MEDFNLKKYLAEGKLLKETKEKDYYNFLMDLGGTELAGHTFQDMMKKRNDFNSFEDFLDDEIDFFQEEGDVEIIDKIKSTFLNENKILEIENLSDSESIDAINFITDTLKKVTGYEMEGTTRYGFTIDEPNGFTVTWRDVSDRWTIDLELRQFQAVVYLNIEGRGKIVLDSPEAFETLRTNIISKIGKLESFSSRWDYDDYDLNNILGITFRNKLLK